MARATPSSQKRAFSLPLLVLLAVAAAVSRAEGRTLAAAAAPATATFVNYLTIPGNATDLMPPLAPGEPAALGRLGDLTALAYSAAADAFYALGGRGPAAGGAPYVARVHRFKMAVSRATGAVANFSLQATLPLHVPKGGVVNGVAAEGDGVLYFDAKAPAVSFFFCCWLL